MKENPSNPVEQTYKTLLIRALILDCIGVYFFADSLKCHEKVLDSLNRSRIVSLT